MLNSVFKVKHNCNVMLLKAGDLLGGLRGEAQAQEPPPPPMLWVICPCGTPWLICPVSVCLLKFSSSEHTLPEDSILRHYDMVHIYF